MMFPKRAAKKSQDVEGQAAKPERRPHTDEDMVTIALDTDRVTFADLLQKLVEERTPEKGH